MPFAIMFMPTTAAALPARIEQQAQSLISALAIPADANGTMRSKDGVTFSFQKNTIRLDQLSPGICQIVFDVAKQTNSYVDTEGSDARPIKILGALGDLPKDFSQVISASTASGLCFTLKRRLWAWKRSEKRDLAYGLIDKDDKLLDPPAAPGSEPRLAADPSGIAAKCAANAKKTFKSMGWNMATVVISQNPKWGVVWRADFVPGNAPNYLWREICWQRQGLHGGLAVEIRPLQMANEAETVAPLAPPP